LTAIVVVIVWLYIIVVPRPVVCSRLIGLTSASSAVASAVVLSLVAHFLQSNVKVHFKELTEKEFLVATCAAKYFDYPWTIAGSLLDELFVVSCTSTVRIARGYVSERAQYVSFDSNS
jgi:hypothetical protein